MQQVLEAPSIQDKEPMATAIAGDYPTTRSHKRDTKVIKTEEKTRPLLTLVRFVKSVFARPGSQHIPACVATKSTNEAALDNICRVDPYLYIKAIAG
jgi:hypothetical protein